MHPKMTQLPGRPKNLDAASAPEGLDARQAGSLALRRELRFLPGLVDCVPKVTNAASQQLL
jgi:hypothetical protein